MRSLDERRSHSQDRGLPSAVNEPAGMRFLLRHQAVIVRLARAVFGLVQWVWLGCTAIVLSGSPSWLMEPAEVLMVMLLLVILPVSSLLVAPWLWRGARAGVHLVASAVERRASAGAATRSEAELVPAAAPHGTGAEATTPRSS
jgi:hypothetical protein